MFRFYLNGEKKGTKEIWADLPGFGDTIRLSDHGTLFVPFALAMPPGTPSLLGMLGEYPLVRSLLAAVINKKLEIEFVFCRLFIITFLFLYVR